jgi:hypothetical protein
MYPESIPLDYTGYGPTGTGYRPNAGAMRRQAENKYRTNRNVEMMSYIDPAVNAAMGAVSSAYMGANNDPVKVREYMNNSAQGQALRDGAMWARQTGFLGAGNPVNYSHNITRGITGGGFKTDVIGKDPSGRSVLGLDQRVQGNGLLAERVTQRFQKGLLDNLYGKDAMADPSKLSGFDMEEASGVAATIMRRGGVGKAATYIRGADAQTRVDAARDAATPEMRDKLAGVRVGSNEELASLAESTQDPKLKKELGRLAKSTDAIVTNDGASKKVADTVREVTKGMAALSDMYGELSAPELHQMLESISGQQIVNKQQAKHATRMANEMRNSADALGMDPRAYSDYAQQFQMNSRQQFMSSGGFDERSGTSATKASAEISAQMLKDAAAAATMSQQATADGEALGMDMTGTTRSAMEIGIDLQNQQTQSQERSRGEAMLRGGLNSISDPEMRSKAAALLAAKGRTTDDGERKTIEDQIKAFSGRQWGGKSMTFEAADASAAGREFKARGFVDPEQIRSSQATDMAALNTSVIDDVGVNKLGMAQPDAEKFSKRLVSKLGKKGMVDLAKIAMGADQVGDQKITAKERNEQISNLFARSGMSEDEANDTRSKLFDSSTGRFKDAEAGKSLGSAVGLVSWGGLATYEQREGVEGQLAQRGANNNRDKIGTNGDGKVTIAGIANAMLNKAIGGAEDPETMALTLQAMKDEGMTSMMVDAKDDKGKTIMENGKVKQINAMEGFDSGINMSENISVEAAERLTKVNGGKDLGLLKKFGYKDNAEMAEKTKDPFERKKVLDYLDENTDLNLTGDLKNTTAISDSTLQSARDAKNGPAAEMRKRAASLQLSGGIEGVKYAVDDVGYKTSEKWFNGGRQFTHMENNRKFVTAAQNINSADADEMKNISELNSDGSLGKSMEAQLKSLKEAKSRNIDTVIARDPVTGKEVTNNTDDSIAKLEAAIAKLAGAKAGSELVTEMRVTNLHIDNVSDLKKS